MELFEKIVNSLSYILDWVLNAPLSSINLTQKIGYFIYFGSNVIYPDAYVLPIVSSLVATLEWNHLDGVDRCNK